MRGDKTFDYENRYAALVEQTTAKPLAQSANPLAEYTKQFDSNPMNARNRYGACLRAKIRAQARQAARHWTV